MDRRGGALETSLRAGDWNLMSAQPDDFAVAGQQMSSYGSCVR